MPISVVISTSATSESGLFLLNTSSQPYTAHHIIKKKKQNLITKQTLCYSISEQQNNTEGPQRPLKTWMKLLLASAGTQHAAKEQDVASRSKVLQRGSETAFQLTDKSCTSCSYRTPTGQQDGLAWKKTSGVRFLCH